MALILPAHLQHYLCFFRPGAVAVALLLRLAILSRQWRVQFTDVTI
ncbi:hypothetical protein RNAN_0453 [Rheinheimera nanhaiensis E407-8]|uniref:Uncharacterized protein n=1 Tax=Rheinheimera nanhaiensis E407-8 TaxID=562729 RepID=I1DTV7_9GAMM|nr:hypothetical protein RNAN_0453 [Rheinheimera nanhaiensis E407-8]